MSDGCGKEDKVIIPNIILNITFNDNRLDKDASTYVDHVIMEGENCECGCDGVQDINFACKLCGSGNHCGQCDCCSG